MTDSMLAGLDIGTSKVTCVVAELDDDGELVISSVGEAAMRDGARHGLVVNLQQVSETVERAIEQAELVLPWSIDSVYISISGEHVRGFAGRGSVSVGSRNEGGPSVVSDEDVQRAEEAARAVSLPPGCIVLDTVRRDYAADSFERLRQPPLGLKAEQISARIYTVIADRVAVDNLVSCVEEAGREVAGMIPAAVASGRAVLTDDEMEVGVAAVDMGAGTTDLAVFRDGSLAHLAVIPMGGDLITGDLQALRISRENAEEIKREWAAAASSKVDPNKTMKVSRLGGRGTFTVTHSVVSQIVIDRYVEIMEAVADELARAGFRPEDLPAGMVLTGGCSRMLGARETAGDVTGLGVELGRPDSFRIATDLVASPEYSTASGLLPLAMSGDGENGISGKRIVGEIVEKLRDLFGKVR
ncbi:MAG: cell division protein FtsA [Candidatus Fermentibacterota bacterium]